MDKDKVIDNVLWHIRQEAKRRGISRTRMLKEMGIPQSYYWTTENRRCEPKTATLQTIADYIGIAVKELTGAE